MMRLADDWVRLGLALAIIALVSLAMYQFGAHAHAVDATFVHLGAQP
jgi:hypothetical protein